MMRFFMLACVLATLVVSAARAPAQEPSGTRTVSASGGATMSDGARTAALTAGQAVIGPTSEVDRRSSWGFWYTLRTGEVSGSTWPLPLEPIAAHVMQVSPNPARDVLVVRLRLAAGQTATFVVSDPGGRELARFGALTLPQGDCSIALDVTALASGTYLLRLESPTPTPPARFVVLH